MEAMVFIVCICIGNLLAVVIVLLFACICGATHDFLECRRARREKVARWWRAGDVGGWIDDP